MTTAEEKIEWLIDEVKALQGGQVKIATSVEAISTWSVNAEKISGELSKEIQKLTSRIAALETIAPTAQESAPAREEEGRAKGHRVLPQHQGDDARLPNLHRTLVRGEKPYPNSIHADDISEYMSHRTSPYLQQSKYHEFKLPRVDFPRFESEHPKIWREKCEKYFTMYRVPVEMWVPLATINFDSNSALWLQTYEAQHAIETWADLCIAMDKKFGRDLYQNHMRDMLNIKQTSDVLEYAARFEQAKHRVLVHNRDLDDTFFVQKFLDGLKYNISNAIALHRPRTVDAALSLALM